MILWTTENFSSIFLYNSQLIICTGYWLMWFTSIYGCRTFAPIFLKCESTFAPLITNPFVPRIWPYLYFHRIFIEPFCASTFCMYMYHRASTFQELILHFKIRWSLKFDQLTCGVVLQKCIFEKGANGACRYLYHQCLSRLKLPIWFLSCTTYNFIW
jgi:hypothetical protein